MGPKQFVSSPCRKTLSRALHILFIHEDLRPVSTSGSLGRFPMEDAGASGKYTAHFIDTHAALEQGQLTFAFKACIYSDGEVFWELRRIVLPTVDQGARNFKLHKLVRRSEDKWADACRFFGCVDGFKKSRNASNCQGDECDPKVRREFTVETAAALAIGVCQVATLHKREARGRWSAFLEVWLRALHFSHVVCFAKLRQLMVDAREECAGYDGDACCHLLRISSFMRSGNCLKDFVGVLTEIFNIRAACPAAAATLYHVGKYVSSVVSMRMQDPAFIAAMRPHQSDETASRARIPGDLVAKRRRIDEDFITDRTNRKIFLHESRSAAHACVNLEGVSMRVARPVFRICLRQ